MCSSILFLCSPSPLELTSSSGQPAFVCPQKTLFFSDKPSMHLLFHVLVTGELAALQSVFGWTRQVIIRRS
jgi:hypothetical protein